jgi:hypothetical protein
VNEVVIPRTVDGRRSSAALGRAVVADALRVVDPVAAAAAEQEADWRRGYLRHFRALIEAGVRSGDAGYAIAEAGLASVRDRMRVDRDGTDLGLDEAFTAAPDRPLRTATVDGSGKPERELTLSYALADMSVKTAARLEQQIVGVRVPVRRRVRPDVLTSGRRISWACIVTYSASVTTAI